MNDLFISYKREDQARVAPIVEGLRAAGLSVWWDRDVGGGESWRQRIQQQLEAARCVVVVWSETSVGPLGEFVHDEAGRAKARGVLLPVRIDAVSAPIGFGEVQTLDLVKWRGSPRDARFRFVVANVKAIVSGGPRPRARLLSRPARLVAAVVSAVGMVTAVVGFFTGVLGLPEPVCKVPGIHALCARWGLGGVPTPKEEALWKGRQPSDCGALRTYLARYPDGAHADEAERRLQAVTTASDEHWTPLEQRMQLVVRSSQEPVGNEKAARTDALKRGEVGAVKLCKQLEAGRTHRLIKVEVDAQTWRCFARGSGSVCGFEGEAVCQVEARSVETREVCP